MTACGFLRGRWLCTSNTNANTNSSVRDAEATAGRASREPVGAVTTGGTRTTGTGAIGASVEAMNDVPTQISS